MKNKTKTYILIILVFGIWGIIGYKILAVVNPNDSEVEHEAFNMSFEPTLNIALDTFSISVAERDPFLGTMLTKKKKVARPKKVPSPKTVWPPILYHGTIAKQESKIKVFVVSINGSQRLMKIGQTFNEIKMVSGNSKSITVSYKGTRKTVQKT